jgi:hypothetical protein
MSARSKSLISATIIRGLLARHCSPRAVVQVRLDGRWRKAELHMDGREATCLRVRGATPEVPWMGMVQVDWAGPAPEWMRFTTWGRREEDELVLQLPRLVEVPELRAHRRHSTVATSALLQLGGRSLTGEVDDLSIAGAGLILRGSADGLEPRQQGTLTIANNTVGRVEVPVQMVSARPRPGGCRIAVTFGDCPRASRRVLLNHIWYAADPSRYAQAGAAR